MIQKARYIIMNKNILAVDVKHMSVYDFLQDGESESELLTRANDYRQKQINSWDKNRKEYPCEQYETYYKGALQAEYKILTWNEFAKLKKAYYITDDLAEITADRYDEMLNVLPPLKWRTVKGVEMFCISEMTSGTYTSQYARYDGKYYTKTVDVMDESTWIYNLLTA